MIHRTKPDDFSPKFEIVSCFIEVDGEILLLHRQDHKTEGNTWGAPAGKVDKGENTESAITREVFEETGYIIDADKLEYIDVVFIRFDAYDFIYHMFRLPLSAKPEIKISSDEHKAYAWRTPEAALSMPLIQDEDACIKLVYNL